MAIVQRTADNDDCHSFDLIIKNSDSKIRILIQSLIHSSDPGQYGVNKSNETGTWLAFAEFLLGQ